MNLIREIIPLTQGDCFSIYSRSKKELDIPVHTHDNMELTLIINGKGTKRVVGNQQAEIGATELILLGSDVPHGWLKHKCKSTEIKQVTLHFHKDLLDEKLLNRNQLVNIKNIFEQASKGILFTIETIEKVSESLIDLVNQNGFASVLAFLSIINELSLSRYTTLMAEPDFKKSAYSDTSSRIERVFDFMNAHYSVQVTLAEVSKIANMPEASFSRFIKQRTGYTFIDSLNEIRLSHVSRLLIESKEPVAEIAYKCGFNNLANFNRTFKSKKGCTPKEFRESNSGKSVFK
jgi:AraC-like DNA-binding protein